MQWVELIIAGLVGLMTSLSLISFILQATTFGRRNINESDIRTTRGSGFFGMGLAKAMILVFCVLVVLLETDFFLKSERILVMTAGLVIVGVLVGLAAGNLLTFMAVQASGGSRARDAHHTHQVPVPRLGGVAMAGGMAAVVLAFIVFDGSDFVMTSQRWLIVVASLTMFCVGLWDDLFSLGAKRKLLLQLAIASVTYFLGIGISHFRIPFVNHIVELGIWSWPVTVIWLVAMTNLINLIDGVDGLAGGICLMLMLLLLYVSNATGSVPIITAGMVGAILGFLRFNFPPARIYMGDGGAYFLGFLIGSTTIVTAQKGTIFAGLVAPLFVLALPIIDTSLAILRRGLRGLPLFRPDRKHIHHRLLAMGHSRRKVVLGLYAFTAFFLVLGFVTFCWHGQYFPLIMGVGVLTVLVVAGKLSFSREWFSIGRVVGNSLMSRQDVQYAMCLSKWLAMEGTRAESIENLAEDAVIMACKLGFSSVRIRLEDGEKFWQIDGNPLEAQEFFKHGLPGRNDCVLELGVLKPVTAVEAPIGVQGWHTESTFEVLADLLAEGWVRAVGDWEKINQSTARFTGVSQTSMMTDTTTIIRRFKAS